MAAATSSSDIAELIAAIRVATHADHHPHPDGACESQSVFSSNCKIAVQLSHELKTTLLSLLSRRVALRVPTQ